MMLNNICLWWKAKKKRKELFKTLDFVTKYINTTTPHKMEDTYSGWNPYKEYYTCNWKLNRFEITRMRCIRGDLVTVLENGQQIAAWVDQSYQWNGLLRYNDITCIDEFNRSYINAE